MQKKKKYRATNASGTVFYTQAYSQSQAENLLRRKMLAENGKFTLKQIQVQSTPTSPWVTIGG